MKQREKCKCLRRGNSCVRSHDGIIKSTLYSAGCTDPWVWPHAAFENKEGIDHRTWTKTSSRKLLGLEGSLEGLGVLTPNTFAWELTLWCWLPPHLTLSPSRTNSRPQKNPSGLRGILQLFENFRCSNSDPTVKASLPKASLTSSFRRNNQATFPGLC